MPSSKNLIQSLRSAHDPHFKLEGKVGGLEKGLGIEVAKLHKTLSKSFAMQRKTLARVLGLEGRLSELEAQQAAEDQAKEGIDDLLGDILGEDDQEDQQEEVGDTKPKAKTKPKKKKPAAKKKKRPVTPVGKKIPQKKKPSLKVKKKKIKAKDLGYSSRVFGKDQSGKYLSSEERKRRFKLGDKQPEGELSKDVVEPPAQPDAQQPQLDGVKGSQKSPMLEGIKSPLKAIAESIDRIKDSLTGQSKVQEDAIEDARKSDEEKEAKKAESGLEKLVGPVKAAGEKILAPVKGIFGQVWDFIKTIFLGRIAFKLFEWFSNPANTDKITSIFKFIADWWPVLLAGIMAFLPGLLGPGGLILGTIALLAWGVPKIINAVKSIFGFGKDIDKELKTGSDGMNKDIENIGKDTNLDKDIPSDAQGDPSKASTPPELSGAQDSQTQVQNLNKGGEVQGSGDKDTVPAMLTPGEFVMSKGAVEQYGVNTLEGMNAAAGGTNIPTMQKGGGKGMNLGVPRFGGGGFSNVTNTETTSSSDSGGNFSFGKSYVAPAEAKERLAAMGMPSMELSDGSVVPDFGKMGGQSVTQGLQLTRDMMVENGASPDRIAKVDELMAMPDAQPESIATKINQIVPGSMENTMMNVGDSITASARMNGGGLVPAFAGGGIVGRLKNAGANVLGKAKAQISKLQKPRVDHIHPPADPVSNAGAAQVAQSSSDAVTASTEPAPGIPDFDAGMMRSQSKIRTLGVSV